MTHTAALPTLYCRWDEMLGTALSPAGDAFGEIAPAQADVAVRASKTKLTGQKQTPVAEDAPAQHKTSTATSGTPPPPPPANPFRLQPTRRSPPQPPCVPRA